MTPPFATRAPPQAWCEPWRIEALLRTPAPSPAQVQALLARARRLEGLTSEGAAALLRVEDPDLRRALEETAAEVRAATRGRSVVVCGRVHVASPCAGACAPCAARRADAPVPCDPGALVERAQALACEGHRRALVCAGGGGGPDAFEAILDAVDALGSVRIGAGPLRRVDVAAGPLDLDHLRRLQAAGVRAYHAFQETYHLAAYQACHAGDPARGFEAALAAVDDAVDAGLDVGLGVLLGRHDWRFEVVALVQHAAHLAARAGVHPCAVALPRLLPGPADAASPVPDDALLAAVAVLRLALPGTGLLLATSERRHVRARAHALGATHLVVDDPDPAALAPAAELRDVVRELGAAGLAPSFCTACDRLGRAAEAARRRPGALGDRCEVNAVASLATWLRAVDAPPASRGRALLARRLAELDEPARALAAGLVARAEAGERDALV